MTARGGPACEVVADGLLAEPVSAWTSLAFVVAGALILLRARRDAVHGTPGHAGPASDVRRVLTYAGLVAAVGVGSVVQHGPDPAWSDVAHDLPLLATLAFVGADAAADLTGRPRGWWWSLPTAALLTLVVVAPRAGDLAQVGVAAVAAVLTVLRGAARPGLRRHIGPAIALLALGGTIGTPSRAGWPWCDPMSLLQGHAVWHMLASAALVVLAPTVGTRGTRAHRA